VTADLDALRSTFAELQVADCLVYLVALSDALGVDVVDDAVTRIRGAVEASTA
jgi:hypothetical protein